MVLVRITDIEYSKHSPEAISLFFPLKSSPMLKYRNFVISIKLESQDPSQ